MEVNIHEVSTYLNCPLLWKYKYQDQLIPQKRFLVKEVFDQAVHQLFYYLFNQVANRYYPPEIKIKQAWGRIWCPDRSKQAIIMHSSPKKVAHTPRHKERQGLEMGLLLREHYKEKPGVPILIGQSYNVPLGKYIINGTIELARVVDDEVEIIDAVTADKRLNPIQLRRNIELTAASYALRYLLKVKETRVGHYYLDSANSYYSTRDRNDYTNLICILNNFTKAIRYSIIIPNIGNQCSDCNYKQYCMRKDWLGGN